MRRFQIFFATMITLLAVAAEGAAQTKTKVIDNGPDAGKKVIAVLGDGYTQADQALYDTHVENLMTNGVFGNDFFREHHNAFNVYRINLVSSESGVSQVRYNENGTPSDPSDDTVASTTKKNTALEYSFSGSWAHCWIEGSPKTETLVQNTLKATVPNADYVVVILNEPGFGGCAGGGRAVVTSGVGWQVLAHEFGHSIGGLLDEYSAGRGAYTGSINNRNCSTEVNSVFWGRFISPATLQIDPGLPTVGGGVRHGTPITRQPGMDPNRTVGIFEGCGTYDTGIYRPVDNCRMKGNTPNFCPVCQAIMRKSLYPFLNHDFDNAVVGDFNADGRSDLLVHNGNDVAIYQSSFQSTVGYKLDQTWIANNAVPPTPGSTSVWTPASGDRYYVADFDDDGKDDLYAFNGTNRSQPRLGLLKSNGTGFETVVYYDFSIGTHWYMKPDDELLVADFNDDGKDDLYIFNGASWSQSYLGMAQSTGSGLSFVVRYAGAAPGWVLGMRDKFYVADFDDDGKDDLYAFSGTSWGSGYLGMLKSFGNGLLVVNLYPHNLYAGWKMAPHDEHYVGDIDGDGKDDLYVFNWQDWDYAYLGMTKSTGTSLNVVRRYAGSPGQGPQIPGWRLAKGDRFYVSNFGFDRRSDLVVYNTSNWVSKYLGKLVSSGMDLSGSWSMDWVGNWNLGRSDQILVGNYSNVGARPDVFIRNSDYFGMLRGESSGFSMDRIYFHWLYTPLFDSKPWSDSMP